MESPHVFVWRSNNANDQGRVLRLVKSEFKFGYYKQETVQAINAILFNVSKFPRTLQWHAPLEEVHLLGGQRSLGQSCTLEAPQRPRQT